MRCARLFEFGDLSYLPPQLRSGLQNFLNVSHRVMGFYRDWVPQLADVIRATGAQRIIDLCSGGGALMPLIVAELDKRYGIHVPAMMTDLYPNPEAIRRFRDDRSTPQLEYCSSPIDATAIPVELTGVRTLFNGFHHMPPAVAQGILADAFSQRQPICIFEYNRRSPLAIASSLSYPLLVLALTPWIRPLRWWQWCFTYLIPVFPLLIGWDGFVSNLRCYNMAEFRSMIADLHADDYRWRMGIMRTLRYPIGLTYLIGMPVSPLTKKNSPMAEPLGCWS